MKTAPARLCFRIGLGTVGLLLASCALPPQQAWRVIKRDGLIPYLAMEINHKQPQPTSRYIGSPQVAQTAPAKPADQSKTAVAPVTPPPAPVLVNRSAATTTALAAPTSGRPAKPQARSAAEALAATPKPAPAKKSGDTVVKAPVPAPKPQSKSAAPSPAPAKKPEPKAEVAAKPAPAPAPKPAAPPADSKPSAPAPAKTSVATTTSPTKSEDLPYGSPVAGRPGLVNSPYAGKMQLVDVTGLKPGQEVKCPYSGKLFRVPPGATATAKQAADAPAKK